MGTSPPPAMTGPKYKIDSPELLWTFCITMDIRLPELVAVDLDYTIWDPWVGVYSGLHDREKNASVEVVEKYTNTVSFYSDVAQILHRLRAAGVIIAACSRTNAPALARKTLDRLLVPSKPGDKEPIRAIELFDHVEIYTGSKISHFKQLHDKTGLPYSEMIFFDDEGRNSEVEKLGVTFCLVPQGLTNGAFEKGIAEWRGRHPEVV